MTGIALGIDVGTSGVRAVVLDIGAQTVAAASAQMGEFGSNHRDPSVWARALEAALARLADQVTLSRIEAVSVDGTSGTVLGLDAVGAPVGTALMYNDAAEDPAIAASIDAVAPRDTAARGAASALARAIELQERPNVVSIVHQADWIAGLLATSLPPTDESNALKTGYDPRSRCWPDWLSDTPLNVSLLPPVLPAGTGSGVLSGRFGLRQGTPLVAGVTDGCASFLATGAESFGDCVTALGTTLTIKLLSEYPVFAPEYGVYSHRIGERWLAGGASNSGGGALAQFFTADQISDLSNEIEAEQPSGLNYYPLAKPGERFPISDPELLPRLEPRPAEDHVFLHGLLEGIARIEAQGYQRLRELGATPPRTLRSVGGGAANPVWSKIRTRIVGLPDHAAASSEAAAGTARLALAYISAGT